MPDETGVENQFTDEVFMSRFGEMMEIPEGVGVGDLADHLEKIQAAADRLAEVEARNKEYEATIAQLSASQPATKEPEQLPGETKAEAKKRFEVSLVSDELKPYIRQDYVRIGESGYYEPNELLKGTPQVLRACQAMNDQLRQQQQILETFTTNPYDVVDECVRHSPVMSSLRKEFEDWKKQIEGRIQPIDTISKKLSDDEFNMRHVDVLTQAKQDDPSTLEWSKAGEYFNKMVGKGVDREVAIELAREYANDLKAAAPAPPPPKKKVMERIEKRTQATGNLMVDRGPKSPFETPAGKWRQEMRDVRRRVHEDSE